MSDYVYLSLGTPSNHSNTQKKIHWAKRDVSAQVPDRDRLIDSINVDCVLIRKNTKRGSPEFTGNLLYLPGGRYWVRTNDFHRVKVTLYR